MQGLRRRGRWPWIAITARVGGALRPPWLKVPSRRGHSDVLIRHADVLGRPVAPHPPVEVGGHARPAGRRWDHLVERAGDRAGPDGDRLPSTALPPAQV